MEPRPKLLLDSGASFHVVGARRLLSNLRDAPAGMRIRVADGNTLTITKIGDIQMADAGFTIPDVYLAPGIKMNLISVRQLTRQSCRIRTYFDKGQAKLYVGDELVGVADSGPGKYGLYVLQFLNMMPISGSDEEETRLLSVCRGSAPTSFGSMVCWLRAFVYERLFGSGPEKKPMQEPHVSNRNRRERRRKKGKNSGRRREPSEVFVLQLNICLMCGYLSVISLCDSCECVGIYGLDAHGKERLLDE